ncbi:type II secretion system F family protein [Risungbinella massiliensis]|uniref:type II secretion system F family protein n=1 Tax=Risungbinella massiliensis TaxID=1329796 RepID=UPI0005CBF4D8|nr:type II secretion system F family protein [Risungbinella massiliensis]
MSQKKKYRIRWTDNQVYSFCFQLSDLLGSGLPLLSSLEVLEQQRDFPIKWLHQIKIGVQRGERLSETLRKVCFPAEAIAFIAAAEEHGSYAWGCQQTAQVYQTKMAFQEEIQKAIRYPILVLIVITIALIFLHQLIVPRFESLYQSLDVSLPWFTQIVFPISLISCFLFGCGLGVILFLVYGKALWMRMDWILRLLFRIPMIKTILPLRYGHYFSLQLGAFLKAGIPVVQALQILERLTPWYPIKKNITVLLQYLLKGESLTNSFQKVPYPFFDSVLHSFLSIAEQTGETAKGLERYADLSKKRLSRYLEKTMKRLEPTLILLLGLLVGGIVLALFLPMFQLIQVI